MILSFWSLGCSSAICPPIKLENARWKKNSANMAKSWVRFFFGCEGLELKVPESVATLSNHEFSNLAVFLQAVRFTKASASFSMSAWKRRVWRSKRKVAPCTTASRSMSKWPKRVVKATRRSNDPTIWRGAERNIGHHRKSIVWAW